MEMKMEKKNTEENKKNKKAIVTIYIVVDVYPSILKTWMWCMQNTRTNVSNALKWNEFEEN